MDLSHLKLSCVAYMKPSGALCLDFTPEPVHRVVGGLLASTRYTRSSRTPARINVGTVYTRRVQWKTCPQCGGVCDGHTEPGRHAPRAMDGKTVNCVGETIQWP